MKKEKREFNYYGLLVTILFIVVSAIGVGITIKIHNKIESSNGLNVELTSKDEERKALEQLLEDNGIDKSILNEKSTTSGGATILGDAKPVKQFKTLHDSEEYYKSYFGFHNTIECFDGFELVGMYCINDQFMEGIYENEEGSLVVKFSKTVELEELMEPYYSDKYTDIKHLNIIGNIEAHVEGIEGKYAILGMSFKNGKSYCIYYKTGMNEDKALEICTELVYNLMAMDDWE